MVQPGGMAGDARWDVGLAPPARGGGGPARRHRAPRLEPVRAAGPGAAPRARARPRPLGRARDPPRFRLARALAPRAVRRSHRSRRGDLRGRVELAVVLKIFRWAPGARERLAAFDVVPREGLTVLDALVEIQRRADPTLAFRYACRVGMCGSCAMVVNGRERWACRTLLAGLGDPVTVRPLYHFPLVRDLVVDMAPFVERMRAVDARFVPGAAGELSAVGRDSAERRGIDP